MNRADLLEAIARSYAGDRDAAATALDAVLDSIATELSAGGVVVVAGFGTFQTVARLPRTVRDPRTGRQRQVKATPVPQFRPRHGCAPWRPGPRSRPVRPNGSSPTGRPALLPVASLGTTKPAS